MNRLIASALSIPLWGWVITGVFAASLCVLTAIFLGEEHQDGDRPEFAEWNRFEAEEERRIGDWKARTLAGICSWCTTGEGRCICPAKQFCPSELCAAEDTSVQMLTRDQMAYLQWVAQQMADEGFGHG